MLPKLYTYVSVISDEGMTIYACWWTGLTGCVNIPVHHLDLDEQCVIDTAIQHFHFIHSSKLKRLHFGSPMNGFITPIIKCIKTTRLFSYWTILAVNSFHFPITIIVT